MAAGWRVDQTTALIELWSDANVQNKLDGVQRNRTIYENIVKEMEKET